MIEKWLKVTYSIKSPGWKYAGLQAGEGEGVAAFIRNATSLLNKVSCRRMLIESVN
jgi:hypothetical protein